MQGMPCRTILCTVPPEACLLVCHLQPLPSTPQAEPALCTCGGGGGGGAVRARPPAPNGRSGTERDGDRGRRADGGRRGEAAPKRVPPTRPGITAAGDSAGDRRTQK